MMKNRLRSAILCVLLALSFLFAAPAGAQQDGDSDGASPRAVPAPGKRGHHHYDQRKHPTALDPIRFVTSRKSRVKLPLPEEREAFAFVVFGDRTGGPPEGIAVLEEAVRNANLFEPDLVMTVGDLVQGYNRTEQWMPQMREYREVMGKLLCPWFPVAGNHDVYWRGPGRPAGEHEKSYEMYFGPLWYAFEHKNCWFIALYSDEGNPTTGEKNFGKPACQKMSPEQFAWLEETLEKARDARHIFLFLHHPRWLGGGYGSDWERVHQLLSKAGNTSIVFAGHIHHMRYDGPRDGIEYITLATVGGGQSSVVPRAGYLHQYHVVTVRDDQIAIAAIPVGEAIDVRALTGEVVTDTKTLARIRPEFGNTPHIGEMVRLDIPLAVSVENPVNKPIEVSLAIASGDARWRGGPDHQHAVIPPGQSKKFRFTLDRIGEALGIDDAYRRPDVVLNVDYLGKGIRVPIPESRSEIPLRVEMPAPAGPGGEIAAVFDGKRDCLAVPDAMLPLPDGPFTLECWFKAESYGDRTGLVTKTESSEYGIFVNKGVPHFSVFLGDSYATIKTDEPILKKGVWQHIAAVYDGAEVRLYVDGKKVAATKRNGRRRTNRLPLLIGADVSRQGRGTSFFDGAIDSVRLTAAACYRKDSFEPERRLAKDAKTVLLLNMDGMVGPWLYDESGNCAHPRPRGAPQLVDFSN